MARNQRGQALAELALLIPVLTLVILALLHLLLVVRVKVELQKSAAKMVEVAALGQSTAPTTALEFARHSKSYRWGFPVPSRFGVKSATQSPSRRWSGVAVNKAPARIAFAQVEYRFFSRAASPFYRWVGIPVTAMAELPIEPSAPGEGS